VIRGEGIATIKGVTPDEVFDFVLDPAQYTKADTKMVWVTKLADTPDGMVAREDGKFMGRFPGSVITHYRWKRPNSIDVILEHGVPKSLHAWFEIDAVEGGTRVRHVEEIEMGHGLLGRLHDVVAGGWFARSVELEVAEIARLLRAGQRGRPLHALEEAGAKGPAGPKTKRAAKKSVAKKSTATKSVATKSVAGKSAGSGSADSGSADSASTDSVGESAGGG
jgi:hypothetical protein